MYLTSNNLKISHVILFLSSNIPSTNLKGHNTQHSRHTGKNVQTEKNIEIQLVRPTEVCGKV